MKTCLLTMFMTVTKTMDIHSQVCIVTVIAMFMLCMFMFVHAYFCLDTV